jgi:hypothetical protein
MLRLSATGTKTACPEPSVASREVNGMERFANLVPLVSMAEGQEPTLNAYHAPLMSAQFSGLTCFPLLVEV